jgi:hypothetical protein
MSTYYSSLRKFFCGSEGSMKKEQNLQKAYTPNFTLRKKCVICEEKLDDNLIISPLDCHKFCESCLTEFFEKEIMKNKIPIKCPGNKDDCEKTFSNDIVLKYAPKETELIFLQLALKKYISNLGEKYFGCPSPGCPFGCEYDEKMTRFSCPLCNKSYCLNCKSESHQGSCNKIKDKSIDRVKQCANCKHWVDKKKDSNSMICRCRNEFCYVCGSKFSNSHKDHSDCEFKLIKDNSNFNNRSQNENSNDIEHNQEYNLSCEYRGGSKNRFRKNPIESNYDSSIPPSNNISLSNTIIMESIEETDDPLTINYESVNEKDSSNTPTRIKLAKSNLEKKSSHSLDISVIEINNNNYHPRKKDGTLDMRYSVNKIYFASSKKANNNGVSNKTPEIMKEIKSDNSKKCDVFSSTNNPVAYVNGNVIRLEDLPRKKDGSLDMRYSINKSIVNGSLSSGQKQSNINSEIKSFSQIYDTSIDSIDSFDTIDIKYIKNPLKKDGTPDMRFSNNKKEYIYKEEALKFDSIINQMNKHKSLPINSSAVPLKKDGTPDMRFACNKRK